MQELCRILASALRRCDMRGEEWRHAVVHVAIALTQRSVFFNPVGFMAQCGMEDMEMAEWLLLYRQELDEEFFKEVVCTVSQSD